MKYQSFPLESSAVKNAVMTLANEHVISLFEGQVEMPQYQVTRESVELLADLQQEHVRFIHWKGNMHLLSSLEGKTDIEILVHPEDRSQFETIVRRRLY